MKSLAKALDILDALAATPEGEAGVSDLSRETAIDKAIVHRVLRTLLERDVVSQDAASKRYRLGTKLVDWTGHRLATDRPLEIARPYLLQLWNACGETVHLTVPVGDRMLVLQVLESVQPIRVSARLGERVELHCTASGKLFLALMPELRERVLAQPLTRVTPHTIVDRRRLARALAEAARDGIAFDYEECLPYANAVAAPVLDAQGRCRAGIAVIGPAARLHGEALAKAAERVRATARAISDAAAHLDPAQWRF